MLNAAGVAPSRLSDAGRELLSEGFLNDAADFFARAGDDEGLMDVIEAAIQEGDLFIYRKGCMGLGREPDREEMETLGEKAFVAGKHLFALEAFREAGLEEKAAMAASEISKKGRPPTSH